MPAATRTRGRSSSRGSGEAQPKSDAYTAMLVLALIAQLVAGTLLAMDYFKYPSEKPPPLPTKPVPQAQGVPPGPPPGQ
jgi:hypothetical protein